MLYRASRIGAIGVSLGAALVVLGEGELETTFGEGGVSRIGNYDALASQADGRLIVAGKFGAADRNEVFLRRFDSRGKLDPTFGVAGAVRITVPVPANDTAGVNASDVLIHPDGSMFVVGRAGHWVSQGNMFLAKRNADGVPAPSFGTAGLVVHDFGLTEWGQELALQGDGRVLALVNSCCEPGTYTGTAHVLRFLPDGALDPSFQGGRVALPTPMFGETLTLDALGNVIVAGGIEDARRDVLIVRLRPDGRVDTTFGAAGVARVSFSAEWDTAIDLLVDPQGRSYVVALSRLESSHLRPLLGSAVARLLADGSADTSFGKTGIVRMADVVPSLMPEIDYWLRAGAIELLPDARLLVVGAGQGPRYMGAPGPGLVNPFGYSDLFGIVLHDDGSVDPDFAFQFFVPEPSWPESRFISADAASDVVVRDRTVIMADGGCQCLVAMRTTGWDTVPDPLGFEPLQSVTPATLQTSSIRTVAGLGDGVSVPFRITGGEWALHGSTTYSTGRAWLRNGAQINVRHSSSSNPGELTTTVVEAGGIGLKENRALILGNMTRSEFTSTTRSEPPPSSPADPPATPPPPSSPADPSATPPPPSSPADPPATPPPPSSLAAPPSTQPPQNPPTAPPSASQPTNDSGGGGHTGWVWVAFLMAAVATRDRRWPLGRSGPTAR